MFIIRTNQIKTWDIKSPRRYNLLTFQENNPTTPPVIDNPNLPKLPYNFIVLKK